MIPAADRTGSKPISPIPITIPMMQIFDFVTLNDIRFIHVYQLLLLSSAFTYTNRRVLEHIRSGID
jgi:hypothetical protein